MTEPKKTNTNPQTKAQIEANVPLSGPTVVLNTDGTPKTDSLPSEVASAPDVSPVNRTQTDEFYELPAVSNVPAAPKEEEIAPVPEVTNEAVDLTEHKTGQAANTTGGQLDLAIDRFHKLQEDALSERVFIGTATVAAKLDLLNRMDVLAQEASQPVANKIALIRAAL
jgi:hypothetical protein